MGSINSFISNLLATNPILFWLIVVLFLVLSGFFGFFINCYLNNNFKMESLIMFLAITLFIISLVSNFITANPSIMIVLLNFFSTVIFSWLLTKKNAKEEFSSTQSELAKRSYRYINTIESAADSASKMIENHNNSSKEELIGKLTVAITSIRSNISTCKMDWFDMLSETDKQIYKETPCIKTPNPDISKMNIAQSSNSSSIQKCDSDDVINQEDA